MWQITPQAVDFARQKGGVITVEKPVQINNCCMKLTEAPKVSLGEPKSLQGYQHLELAEVKVYVPSSLASSDLTIDLACFFRQKYLVIEGWKVF